MQHVLHTGAEVYAAEVSPQAQQLTIAGSKSGTKEDFAGIYELMRSGKLNHPANIISFDEIPGAVDKLHTGGVVGRFIAKF